MKNIIVTGCSYSQKSGVTHPYPLLLKNYFKGNVTNLAWPGQSNDTIIRNVKEQIREGVSDTLFICQLTHLHRISHYCTLNKKWLDFQPAIVNAESTIKDDKILFEVKIYNGEEKRPPMGRGNTGGVSVYGATELKNVNLSESRVEELLDWYQTYLTHLYDEENTFYELHHKIDELTKQVNDSGNTIIYLYWPDINYDSSLFEKNNFLSIDGEYSMLKWSLQKGLTQQKQDTHLSKIGHVELLNELSRYITLDNFDKQKVRTSTIF